METGSVWRYKNWERKRDKLLGVYIISMLFYNV